MPFKILTPERVELIRGYRRKWYRKNANHAKRKVVERRRELRASLDRYKSQIRCQNCGEDHAACLQFHHPNASQKETNVSTAVHRGWSEERILAEIRKCVVLCANCHFKHHWRNK